MSAAILLKSVTGLCPRSTRRMGHRPKFDFWSCLRSSLKVLLRRLILSLDVNLQPPSMCVFVSGDWHFVYMMDGLCFLLHLWICTPHITSSESLLAR